MGGPDLGPNVDLANSPPAAPRQCAVGAPFATPRIVSGLVDVTALEDARFTTDELTTYYTLYGPPVGNIASMIRSAHRTSVNTPFVAGPFITELGNASDFMARGPTLSRDQLTIYFERQASTSPTWAIYTASRASIAAPFDAPTAVPALAGYAAPFLSDDGLRLYVQNSDDGTGTYTHIFVSALSNGAFGNPVLIATISSNDYERTPVESADGLELFFAHAISSDSNVMVVSRTDVSQPFGAPTLVNLQGTSSSPRLPTWLSRNACRLYFSTTLSDGTSAILVAERSSH